MRRSISVRCWWGNRGDAPTDAGHCYQGTGNIRVGEGAVFLIWRAHDDNPDIPDSIAILGCDEAGNLRNPRGGCALHDVDERGLTRLYSLDTESGVWRW